MHACAVAKRLPTFKSYTVDVRVRQFRKVDGCDIEFVDFSSHKGRLLLAGYVDSLDRKSVEFQELVSAF